MKLVKPTIVFCLGWVLGGAIILISLAGTNSVQNYALVTGWWLAAYVSKNLAFSWKLLSTLFLVSMPLIIIGGNLFSGFSHDIEPDFSAAFVVRILCLALVFCSPLLWNLFYNAVAKRLPIDGI